jgi:ATP-dependent Clp protease ATP-binding subunit ClpA
LTSSSALASDLSRLIIGQPEALGKILPLVGLGRNSLHPEGRPVGVFLMLGPTGTGKTSTVEALAQVLHGSPKSLLKIDCGEFQMEHEVAKLIGAPPGYLGHRETQPMLSQQRLSNAKSDACPLSVVLFDEIEKGHQSIQRLLLGVMDKASLRLGDGSLVDFSNSLVFLTSNLGVDNPNKLVGTAFGLGGGGSSPPSSSSLSLCKKYFSPEFMNRIDEVITYLPLSRESLDQILNLQLQKILDLFWERKAITLVIADSLRELLLREGTAGSSSYGAREMKRALGRRVIHPASAFLETCSWSSGGGTLWMTCTDGEVSIEGLRAEATTPQTPAKRRVR